MIYENKDRRPIFYENAEEMDKPISELFERLRTDLSKVRGKLSDIQRSYGFEDRIDLFEGGLTCIISAMYNTMSEFKKMEERHKKEEEEEFFKKENGK